MRQPGHDAVSVAGMRRLFRSAPALAAVAVFGMLTACAGAAADQVEPTATAACAAPELPSVQAGLHLIGDREPPVPYSSTPPTSGWHRSGVGGPGVVAEPLSEPVQVGLLERGLVVVTHGPLSDADARVLADLAGEHPDSLVVTPYAPLGAGEVVAAAWGVLQRCTEVDAEALATFVRYYADPAASGHGEGGGRSEQPRG